MTEILETVKVFARRRQGYDNTSTFSSKTAVLKVRMQTHDIPIYCQETFIIRSGIGRSVGLAAVEWGGLFNLLGIWTSSLRSFTSLKKVSASGTKGENLRHDHVLITVNIFSIKR